MLLGCRVSRVASGVGWGRRLRVGGKGNEPQAVWMRCEGGAGCARLGSVNREAGRSIGQTTRRSNSFRRGRADGTESKTEGQRNRHVNIDWMCKTVQKTDDV